MLIMKRKSTFTISFRIDLTFNQGLVMRLFNTEIGAVNTYKGGLCVHPNVVDSNAECVGQY